tara:strand:- start:393 stop:584 length:192 start_codon:yes stop_codon:yes gene_type:complete
MKKLLLSTLRTLLLALPVLAQNSIWSLPPNYLDFGATPPVQYLPIGQSPLPSENVPLIRIEEN